MTQFVGVDLSEFQNPLKINYDTFCKGIDFAILRVGYTGWGSGKSRNKDTQFSTHYEEMVKRGIPVGVYWYSCAVNKAEGVAEANTVLQLIKGLKIEYPIYIDTEDNHNQRIAPRASLTDALIGFMETIEKAGYWAGYYCSTAWEKEKLDKTRLTRFANWQAQWGGVLTASDCGIWQTTSTGHLAGYVGFLDLDISFIDYKAVIRKAGLNHLPQISAYYPIPKLSTYAQSLRNVGVNPTREMMTKIANANGISDYHFTLLQNLTLLLLLRKGRLKKPQ